MAGERKPYLNDGLYVEMPIVLQVLLTPSELVVLNTVVHLSDTQYRFVSQSLIAIYTGVDKKTVKASLDYLESLGILKKGSTCQRGTHYDINENRLTQIVRTLNHERNPVHRLRIADKIRGEGHAIHAYAIKNYTDTSLDSRN